MIKIGIHLMMWQEGYATPILPLLEKVKQAGFDGAEFSVVRLEKQQEAEEIRKRAADLGLGITCTFGLSPDQDIASDDSKKVAAAIARTKLAIDMAAVLGAPVMAGIFYSGFGVRAESLAEGIARRQRAAENLRSVAEYAVQQGVTIAIEPVNHYETDMINTSQQGIDLINAVGNSSLRILFDVFHASIEENSVPDAIRSSGKFIGHVHFSENHRGIPGTGSLPYSEIMQALRDIQYQGWIVTEIIGVPGGEFARRFKTSVRGETPDGAARLSAAYIRKLIAQHS